jgi:hypothetical protein
VLEADGNLLRESGDFAAAADRYAGARRLFTELGQKDVVRNLEEESAILAARSGSFDEAEHLGSSVVAQWKELDDAEGMASSLLALGEIRVRAGPRRGRPAAARRSRRALRRARPLLSGVPVAALARLCLLPRGRSRRSEGDRRARAVARDALRLSRTADARGRSRRSFLELLGAVEKAPFYLAQPASRTEAARAARPTPQARKSAADLTVRLLGPIEVYRDAEKKIPASAWKIRRSLEMFCFLASSRNRRATKDRLMDALWANARPPSSRRTSTRRSRSCAARSTTITGSRRTSSSSSTAPTC